jgi:hypothetical protein
MFEWRGPSPYHFIEVPPDIAEDLRTLSAMLTYGWGVIPVSVRIGETQFTTSLFPREGGYVLPIKDRVRRAEEMVLGDSVLVEMAIRS